jgi:hypothetical protein
MTLALSARDFIRDWTGLAFAAQRAVVAARFLLGGQLLEAIQGVPCYVALAHGCVRLNLQINIASFLVIIPLLLFLIMKYGLVGTGFSGLVMTLCTMPLFMYLLHRRFLPSELSKWVLRDALRPLLAALPIILLARLFFPVPSSRLLALALIGLVWSMSAVAAGCNIPELCVEFIEKTRRLYWSVYVHR